jgi:hypothetical protein
LVEDYFLTENDELIESFIGKGFSIYFYIMAFTKYLTDDKFKVCWSWAGFFMTYINLIYRKHFLAGFIWFVALGIIKLITGNISILLIPLECICGAILNPYLVYKRYKKTLDQCVKQDLSHKDKIKELKKAGGRDLIITFFFIIMNIIFHSIWLSGYYN